MVAPIRNRNSIVYNHFKQKGIRLSSNTFYLFNCLASLKPFIKASMAWSWSLVGGYSKAGILSDTRLDLYYETDIYPPASCQVPVRTIPAHEGNIPHTDTV